MFQQIYKDFLFHKFLYKFKTYFKLQRKLTQHDTHGIKKLKFLTWEDRTYSSFMIKFMQNLEPRQYYAGEVILRDMEEVEEIQFVIKGEFSVGYTINNEEHLALKMADRNAIGDMSIMFKRRSEFFYRALSEMDC